MKLLARNCCTLHDWFELQHDLRAHHHSPRALQQWLASLHRSTKPGWATSAALCSHQTEACARHSLLFQHAMHAAG